MWRQRIEAYISVKPVLRTTQLVPRRTELRDLEGWSRHIRLHRQLRESGHTILSSRHARDLIRAAEDVERRGVPGDLVDCGVFNGGSTVMLATGAPTRDVWAFDSFEGLPGPTERDPKLAQEWVGKVVGSEDKLRQGFRDYRVDNPLHVVKGWFGDTFPEEADKIDRIALLHVDADWYEPVKLVLQTFYPKVSPGGWVIIDDYPIWHGAKLATDEYRSETGIEAPLIARHIWQKQPDEALQPVTAGV